MIEVKHGIEEQLELSFKEMEREARLALQREGFRATRQRHERSLAVRYKGQSFELEIKQISGNIAAAFHRVHSERYGYAQKTNAVEIVSTRLRSFGIVAKIPQKRHRVTAKRYVEPNGHSKAYLALKEARVAIYRREDLPSGVQLRTPCIVTEYSATTLVPPGARAEVDEYANLIIQLG